MATRPASPRIQYIFVICSPSGEVNFRNWGLLTSFMRQAARVSICPSCEIPDAKHGCIAHPQFLKALGARRALILRTIALSIQAVLFATQRKVPAFWILRANWANGDPKGVLPETSRPQEDTEPKYAKVCFLSLRQSGETFI